MASQDARLSKFEADFNPQQGEMTNKIDTVLKAITDQIAGTLPSDTVKNPKLGTHPAEQLLLRATLKTTPSFTVALKKPHTSSLTAGEQKTGFPFFHIFRGLCYPKNDHEDIRKLGAKGDIGFFIGYFANSCAYGVFNRRTKKIMETMNVTFDESISNNIPNLLGFTLSSNSYLHGYGVCRQKGYAVLGIIGIKRLFEGVWKLLLLRLELLAYWAEFLGVCATQKGYAVLGIVRIKRLFEAVWKLLLLSTAGMKVNAAGYNC
ncbi:hypothetical protein Tco_0966519 [Tanacetum coccineum]